MTLKSFPTSALIALSITILSQVGLAQAPTGDISSPTYSGTRGLYDFTGLITSIEEDLVGNTSEANTNNHIQQSISVTQSTSGLLSGAGTTTVTLYVSKDFNGNPNTFIYDTDYTVKGSVKSAGTNVLVQYTFASEGRTELGDGVLRTVRESMNYRITVRPVEGTMSGVKSGGASASGGGTIKLLNTSIPEQPVPGGLPLDWNLSLNLAADETKVTGTANVHLSNGRDLPFTVKGTYSARSGTKLTLTGSEPKKPAKLKVTLSGDAITGISGKLLGQRVNVTGM